MGALARGHPVLPMVPSVSPPNLLIIHFWVPWPHIAQPMGVSDLTSSSFLLTQRHQVKSALPRYHSPETLPAREKGLPGLSGSQLSSSHPTPLHKGAATLGSIQECVQVGVCVPWQVECLGAGREKGQQCSM